MPETEVRPRALKAGRAASENGPSVEQRFRSGAAVRRSRKVGIWSLASLRSWTM